MIVLSALKSKKNFLYVMKSDLPLHPYYSIITKIICLIDCDYDRSSKETTKAKSPYLRVLQRKERRKMTLATATSAAANNMR